MQPFRAGFLLVLALALYTIGSGLFLVREEPPVDAALLEQQAREYQYALDNAVRQNEEDELRKASRATRAFSETGRWVVKEHVDHAAHWAWQQQLIRAR